MAIRTSPRPISRRQRLASGWFGRHFNVIQESWRLDSDPSEVAPITAVIASQRSASEAADLARQAAAGYARNGYHKPSRAWWGAGGGGIHRFRVLSPRRVSNLAVGLGAAGLAAYLLARWRSQSSLNFRGDARDYQTFHH